MSPLLPDSLPLRVYFLFFLFFFSLQIIIFYILAYTEDDTNIQMRSHYLSCQGLV